MTTASDFTSKTGIAEPNFETIARTLDLICTPGAVHELRVVKHRLGTIAGYYIDREAMAHATLNLTLGLATVEGRFKPEVTGPVEAVYATLNPVVGHKLSIAADRFRILDRTATDGDIERRRRILIDLDPWRAGEPISSSEYGHRNALRRAEEVAGYLVTMEWPEPWLASSGNGGHLGFGCDLPNDDDRRDLIQQFLQAIDARFGDSCLKGKTPFDERLIEIDTSVYNASRLCTIYGTMKRKWDDLKEDKGPSCPARPHRLAKLLQAPSRLEAVPPELIRRVIAECRPESRVTVEMLGDHEAAPSDGTDPVGDDGPCRPQARGSRQQAKADRVLALLERHTEDRGITVTGISQSGDYIYVNFGPCLFDPGHRKASLWIGEDGVVGYGCPHDSCKGRREGTVRRTWADVLEVLGEDASDWHQGAQHQDSPEEPAGLRRAAGDGAVLVDDVPGGRGHAGSGLRADPGGGPAGQRRGRRQ